MAQVIAKRSSCTRRKVGAVLVKENRIISCGYNGTPPKQINCWDGGCPRGQLDGPLPENYDQYACSGCHAEANALLRAGAGAQGAVLYCTHRPCPQCQNLIMGAGVEAVWHLVPDSSNWVVWWPDRGRMD